MFQINNTLFIGKVLLEKAKLDSTNNYGMNLAKTGEFIEGTVIYTPHQTAGKGQRGSQWISEAGQNINLSILFKPHSVIQHQFWLNKAIALGIYRFAKAILGTKIKIKWPNDLYYENKKLGGVLIENIITGTKITASVIGIGINVNQTVFAPHLPNPISFKEIQTQSFDIPSLISQLCQSIEATYLLYKSEKFQIIQKNYLAALYRFKQTHAYQTPKGVLLAQIIAVNENGQVVLQTADQQYSFNKKEIQYI